MPTDAQRASGASLPRVSRGRAVSKRCLLAALVVLSVATAGDVGSSSAHRDRTAVTITPAPAFAPTDLVKPAQADWATNGGDYGQTRYSALTQIKSANVRRLRLAWHIHLNGSGMGSKYRGEGTPLVYKGIMYAVTGANDVFAIDATTGTILWQYSAQLPDTIGGVCCGWLSRGLALGDGKVYVARLDATLVALSQDTGRVVWTASNGSPRDGYTMTMAPLYYNGLVIVGVSGGEFGISGSVTAYDARDGHRVWRFNTDPGSRRARRGHVAGRRRVADGRRPGVEHAERRPEARAHVLHDRQRVPVVEPRAGRQPLHVVVRRGEAGQRRVRMALPGRPSRHLGLRLRVQHRPVRRRRSPG